MILPLFTLLAPNLPILIDKAPQTLHQGYKAYQIIQEVRAAPCARVVKMSDAQYEELEQLRQLNANLELNRHLQKGFQNTSEAYNGFLTDLQIPTTVEAIVQYCSTKPSLFDYKHFIFKLMEMCLVYDRRAIFYHKDKKVLVKLYNALPHEPEEGEAYEAINPIIFLFEEKNGKISVNDFFVLKGSLPQAWVEQLK